MIFDVDNTLDGTTLASAPLSSLKQTYVPFMLAFTNHADVVLGLVIVPINKLFDSRTGSVLRSSLVSSTSSLTDEFLGIWTFGQSGFSFCIYDKISQMQGKILLRVLFHIWNNQLGPHLLTTILLHELSVHVGQHFACKALLAIWHLPLLLDTELLLFHG